MHARPGASLAAVVFATGTVIAISVAERNLALAVYLLGFWQYYLYALAYYFGAVPLAVFKRDAVLMKSVSLITLALAYFTAPLDALSLAVMALGFGLNAIAAHALGPDRTYYGDEVAGLPRLRVDAFPYGWVAHPMLLGNIAAFGGTLINPVFRETWWPLACAHVLMNLGLLAMETRVSPQRGGKTMRGYSLPGALAAGAAGAALGAALNAALNGGPGDTAGALQAGAGLGTVIAACAYVIYCSYSAPTIQPGGDQPVQRGGQA
jgi:hypothetical protein